LIACLREALATQEAQDREAGDHEGDPRIDAEPDEEARDE
jgi:hypothetical protein